MVAEQTEFKQDPYPEFVLFYNFPAAGKSRHLAKRI